MNLLDMEAELLEFYHATRQIGLGAGLGADLFFVEEKL